MWTSIRGSIIRPTKFVDRETCRLETMRWVKCNNENLLWGPIQGSREEGSANGGYTQGSGSEDEEEEVSAREVGWA